MISISLDLAGQPVFLEKKKKKWKLKINNLDLVAVDLQGSQDPSGQFEPNDR